MKKIIIILLITITATTLSAQEQTFTQMFDNVFIYVNRTDAATRMYEGKNKQETKGQAPYKSGVGGVLYPSIAVGPSFKAFFTDNVAFQTDILFRAIFTGGVTKEGSEGVLYFLLETGINFMYQEKFKDKKTYELFWLMGGGVSLGYQFQGYGKFGANAMIGFELCAKKTPLSFQMDLRPGYAMLFNFENEPIEIPLIFGYRYTHKNPWSHFDWLIAFTLRYIFKKK